MEENKPYILPEAEAEAEVLEDSGCALVFFNDDVHTFDYVIAMLCAVFGHGEQLAEKIAVEAHVRGRAIAEVEERAKAEVHAAALRAGGLGATVESVG